MTVMGNLALLGYFILLIFYNIGTLIVIRKCTVKSLSMQWHEITWMVLNAIKLGAMHLIVFLPAINVGFSLLIFSSSLPSPPLKKIIQ